MRERPILFSAPMVRAILRGWKSQTRRVIKPQPADDIASWIAPNPSVQAWRSSLAHPYGASTVHICPYGQRGDRLWGRETHAIFSTHGQQRADGKRWGPWSGLPTVLSPDGTKIAYFREGFDRSDPGRWRPSIHMPRWASRILLEIIGVRVERLQDISEADAIAEGIYAVQCNDLGAEVPYYRSMLGPRDLYRLLWESINGSGSWEANPWVWVIEFPRTEAADQQPKAAGRLLDGREHNEFPEGRP